jgi:hypothetical protein
MSHDMTESRVRLEMTYRDAVFRYSVVRGFHDGDRRQKDDVEC